MPRQRQTPRNARLNPKIELINIHQFSKLAMTFWVGGTLTLASIVVPILFKSLDEISAANLARQYFNLNAYIGIVALLLAALEIISLHKLQFFRVRSFWYVLIMSTTLILNYFAIFPMISELRAKLIDVTSQIIQHSVNFNFWHSVSSILFLINCILGILYIVEQP